MKGRWVRYQLFMRDNGEPIYSNKDGKWSYEYLDSFYPWPFAKEVWLEKFTEYICADGVYTCKLEEVNEKEVPQRYIDENIERHKRIIKENLDRASQYKEELNNLMA